MVPRIDGPERCVAFVLGVLALTVGALPTLGETASPWSERALLTASDATNFSYLGRSVSIDGDVAVVGTPLAMDGDGFRDGAAYVYRFDGTQWVEEQRLVNPSPETGDQFGTAVSVSGDVIVVGVPESSLVGNEAGAVVVFRHDGEAWAYEQTLVAVETTVADRFGGAVSVSGDTLFVGATGDNSAGHASGSVFVFRDQGGGVWSEEARIEASDTAPLLRFGFAVALEGDVGVVSAPGHGSLAGSVYVFRGANGIWTEEQRLAAPDAAQQDEFGSSIALAGTILVVGASGDDDLGSESGSAHVFRRTGASWTHEAKLLDPAGEERDYFGISAAASADRVVVGSWFGEAQGVSSGSAIAFRHDGATWSIEQSLFAFDTGPGDRFGQSLALDGDRLVVGATGRDSVGLIDDGSAYVFDLLRPRLEECQGRDGVDRLFANGGTGVGSDHRVSMRESGPLSLVLQRPSTGGNGRFVLHMNAGAANDDTLMELPFQLGTSCFSFLVSPERHPVAVWNNSGYRNRVGFSQYFGTPIPDPGRAPTTLLDLPAGDAANLPVGSCFTLQALIQNPGSSAARPFSLTNAILLVVE